MGGAPGNPLQGIRLISSTLISSTKLLILKGFLNCLPQVQSTTQCIKQRILLTVSFILASTKPQSQTIAIWVVEKC